MSVDVSVLIGRICIVQQSYSDLNTPPVTGEHKASYRMGLVSIGGRSLWESGRGEEAVFDISSQAVWVHCQIRG